MKVQVRALETKEQLMSELEYKNFLLNHYRDVIDHLKKQNQENNALNDDLQERINNAIDEIAENDTIIEDLKEQLKKATIDYQTLVTENKSLKEQLNDNSGKYTEICGDFQDTADELGATKMMLSTLRKEHDMLQKQYDGLKKTHEETKEKDARVAFEMGQSHAELYRELHEKTTELEELKKKYKYEELQKKNKDYDNLQYKYEKLQKIYNELHDRNSRIINHVDTYMSDNFYNTIVNFCELLKLLEIGDSRFKFENH